VRNASTRIWLGLGLLALAFGGGLLWLRTHDVDEQDSETVETRLDRTSVHFHVALRHRLATEGEPFARRLDRARDDESERARIAAELLEERGSGAALLESGADRSLRPILRLFGAPPMEPAADRFAVLLAMAASDVKERRRVSRHVLAYEATRTDVDALPSALRPLAHGLRAYAFTRDGACDAVTREGRTARALTHRPASEEDRLLDLAHRMLVDGSMACCAMREGRIDAAATELERVADDAAALGVATQYEGMLRAWAALARGEGESARGELEGIDTSRLEEDDVARLRTLRDALASGPDGAREALFRSSEAQWLSSIVITSVVEAAATTELHALLEDEPRADAALRFVEAETAVSRAARDQHPLFDHAHDTSGALSFRSRE